VLQTPANEERTRKRDREVETPLTTSTNQQGEKRQRLNPFSEEEVPIRPSMGMGPLAQKHRLVPFSRNKRDSMEEK